MTDGYSNPVLADAARTMADLAVAVRRELERLNSFAAVTAAAEANLAVLQKNETDLTRDLEGLQQQIATARATLKQAQAEAKRLVSDAQSQSRQILADAQREAAGVTSQARDRATAALKQLEI